MSKCHNCWKSHVAAHIFVNHFVIGRRPDKSVDSKITLFIS